MPFSPLPYNVRWTCKLIWRDFRSLKAKLKAKLFEGAKATAPAYQQDEIDTVIVEREDSHNTEVSSTQDADTVRDVLEEKLKGVYALRDSDMSYEDRWKFRGSWLLLYTAVCVSEMPAHKYAGAVDGHRWYDSVFSTRSKPNLPPKHIWHDLLEAMKSISKINSTAEEILGHIWPEKDVAEILDQIGNPAKQLCDEEDDELREKLRGLLKEY